MHVRNALGVLCDKRLLTKIKRKFYRTIVRLAMPYRFEVLGSQETTKDQYNRNEKLRWMSGSTLMDRIKLKIYGVSQM